MLSIKAFAKINLYLDVVSRYSNGYHEIKSVMQSVSLHDLVNIELSSDLILRCSVKELESESNLAYRAALLLQKKTGSKQGAVIAIKKNIPMAAGLAGGSADAAATLIGLNELWDLGMSLTELQLLGRELGADVPFCCHGGTMLAEGIGDKLSELSGLDSNLHIVVATPPIHVSTAEIYGELDNTEHSSIGRLEYMTDALASKNIYKVVESLANILETVALKRYPEISQIKDMATECGCTGVLMSGSGPSVFSFFINEQQALAFSKLLKKKNQNNFINITKPVEYGAKIM